MVYFPLAFPSKPCMNSSSPFALHAPPNLVLDLIILNIFDEVYKLWSSSLCSFLQPPVTSTLFGPNILFSTRPLTLETKFRTVKNYRQNYSCLYVRHVFSQKRRRKVLDWTVTNIARIQHAHNFPMNQSINLLFVFIFLFYFLARDMCSECIIGR
jgi:hypothetical protein